MGLHRFNCRGAFLERFGVVLERFGVAMRDRFNVAVQKFEQCLP
jgi:hypothetical protein